MGIPTANVAPLSVQDQLADLPKGVYFGFAQLQDPSSAEDGSVQKMVMNYGVRPTIKDGSHVTVRCYANLMCPGPLQAFMHGLPLLIVPVHGLAMPINCAKCALFLGLTHRCCTAVLNAG